MTYHIARNGQQTGTCSREEAVGRYVRGEILPTDLVWCDGMANWDLASKVFGQSPTLSITPPLRAPPGLMSAPTSAATLLPPKPESYLVGGILTTLFCCLPLGIVAIVFASQVDGKYARGDYAGAQDAAKNAKLCTWIAVGIGAVCGVVWMLAMLAGAADGLRH